MTHGLSKAVIFGAVVSLIATYRGYSGRGRRPGRGRGHHAGGGLELGRHPGRRLPAHLHLHRLTAWR